MGGRTHGLRLSNKTAAGSEVAGAVRGDEDVVVVHQPQVVVEDPAATGGGGMGEAMGERGGGGKGPRMLVCYLCGTQHGLSSLAIHQKQCAVKRGKAQALLDPSARTAPASPPDMEAPGPGAHKQHIIASFSPHVGSGRATCTGTSLDVSNAGSG